MLQLNHHLRAAIDLILLFPQSIVIFRIKLALKHLSGDLHLKRKRTDTKDFIHCSTCAMSRSSDVSKSSGISGFTASAPWALIVIWLTLVLYSAKIYLFWQNILQFSKFFAL